MSYLRPFGDGTSPPFRAEDGPITSPSQVDDSVIVGDVGANRVTCSDLPADSPWRKPGQVCAADFNIVDLFTGLLSKLGGALSTTPATAAQPAASVLPTAIVLGGVGIAAYYMFKKPKRLRNS